MSSNQGSEVPRVVMSPQKRRAASEPPSSPVTPQINKRHQNRNVVPNAAVMIDPELAAAENRRLMGILTKYFATHKHKGHLIQDKKTRDVFVRTTDNEDFSFPVMIRSDVPNGFPVVEAHIYCDSHNGAVRCKALVYQISLTSSKIKSIAGEPIRHFLDWSCVEGRIRFREINNAHQQSAAIVQTRGTEATSACTRCSRGNRCFYSCVVFNSSEHGPVAYGACGNCVWEGKGSDCSLRDVTQTFFAKYQPRKISPTFSTSPSAVATTSPDTAPAASGPMLKPCAPVDPPEISPRISFCSSDSVHKSPPARLNGYSFTPKTVSNKYVFLDARVITADIGDLDIALNESKAVINTLEKRIKVLRESEF